MAMAGFPLLVIENFTFVFLCQRLAVKHRLQNGTEQATGVTTMDFQDFKETKCHIKDLFCLLRAITQLTNNH